MIIKRVPAYFIGNPKDSANEIVCGDLIHCGNKTYIKRNDVDEMFDTKMDIWKNCIEVDPKSVVMNIDPNYKVL